MLIYIVLCNRTLMYRRDLVPHDFIVLYFIGFLIQGSIFSLMMATYVYPKHVAVFKRKIKLCIHVDGVPASFLYIVDLD